MTDFVYQGRELDLFARAKNWKAYWKRHVMPFVSGDVLEVGAGNGSNTVLLNEGHVRRWVCLEPDRALVGALQRTVSGAGLAGRCEVMNGTLETIGTGERFDSIVYIDVLEHIDDSKRELQMAAAHLAPGGALIVLAPAHQWLFTAFDEALGHYRRYTKSMLSSEMPPGLVRTKLVYLDSVGLLASAGNRLFMNQSMPSQRQIDFWDGALVRSSMQLDRLLGYSIGKSVLGVWRKPA